MILVLNFSHPLTATQCEELSSEPGIEIEVRTVQVQIDNETLFGRAGNNDCRCYKA